MILTKGKDILVVVTNSENVYETRFIINHPFNEGDKLCNAFNDWECVVVD